MALVMKRSRMKKGELEQAYQRIRRKALIFNLHTPALVSRSSFAPELWGKPAVVSFEEPIPLKGRVLPLGSRLIGTASERTKLVSLTFRLDADVVYIYAKLGNRKNGLVATGYTYDASFFTIFTMPEIRSVIEDGKARITPESFSDYIWVLYDVLDQLESEQDLSYVENQGLPDVTEASEYMVVSDVEGATVEEYAVLEFLFNSNVLLLRFLNTRFEETVAFSIMGHKYASKAIPIYRKDAESIPLITRLVAESEELLDAFSRRLPQIRRYALGVIVFANQFTAP